MDLLLVVRPLKPLPNCTGGHRFFQVLAYLGDGIDIPSFVHVPYGQSRDSIPFPYCLFNQCLRLHCFQPHSICHWFKLMTARYRRSIARSYRACVIHRVHGCGLSRLRGLCPHFGIKERSCSYPCLTLCSCATRSVLRANSSPYSSSFVFIVSLSPRSTLQVCASGIEKVGHTTRHLRPSVGASGALGGWLILLALLPIHRVGGGGDVSVS